MRFVGLGCLVLAAALVSLEFTYADRAAGGSFYIDFDNNTFVKDGKPFRYVSGSIHSYRVPHELWQDRLLKMRAAGLNAIEIYVFWNEHEPMPGVYDFEGQNDIFSFVKLAQSNGLVVIFRAGPYACAEHEYGGLPWWLLANGTNITPRSSDEKYMAAVNRWFDVLLPKAAPYLYKNGGPIITVQIENEYGSYYTCDKNYLSELRDKFREHLGDDTVYFTTDPYHLPNLLCGTLDTIYPTVDFGVRVDVSKAFANQKRFSKSGPYVNSEFYPGWLDFWGTPHQKVNTSDILTSFYDIMNLNANVNFYMFHGGTNWGWSNGADPPYLTQPTSYDYDAPISEPGDITDKYLAIKDAISKYLPIPPIPVPANSTKYGYGKVQMYYSAQLIDVITDMSDTCVTSNQPQTFEALGQGYGFVLYSTTLDDVDVFNKVLSVPGIRDRGYVQIGSASVGVVYRNLPTKLTIKLNNNKNNTLYIIVENMGRLNFGNNLLDIKGIISNVTLDGKLLSNWKMCLTKNFVPNYQENLKQDNTGFSRLIDRLKASRPARLEDIDYNAPAVYIGTVTAKASLPDTFLKNSQFTKGVALLASSSKLSNLGRYWPNVGPQVTLYTPGVFMEPAYQHTVTLIEFEGSKCKNQANCYIEFLDYPIIDSIPG